MKLPIDIPALVTAALDIERARSVVVSVNILIDETVTPEFQAFVRAGFNSESSNARIMLSYFPTQTPDTSLACDVTVIVAGKNPEVGSLAAQFRAQGTPVLVVAESRDNTQQQVQATSTTTIPEEDLIAVPSSQNLNDETKAALADRIGAWLIDAIDAEKQLAFSLAYPFIRRPLAYHAVQTTALQNAGVGVVVFIPGADMPVMTANQAKMVLQIAAIYAQPLSADRVKELAGVLLNALVCRGVARQVAGIVPALGWAVKGSMGYVGTQAIGRAAIEYFEAGGNIAGAASLASKISSSLAQATATLRNQPAYKTVCSTAGPMVNKMACTALDAAAPVARYATKAVFSSLRPGRRKKAHEK